MSNLGLIKIGQNTLLIYILHFIILYGSVTGYGLHYFFKYSLSPFWVFIGAIIFMVSISFLAEVLKRKGFKI